MAMLRGGRRRGASCEVGRRGDGVGGLIDRRVMSPRYYYYQS